MRISDWSSDVCSSDLRGASPPPPRSRFRHPRRCCLGFCCLAGTCPRRWALGRRKSREATGAGSGAGLVHRLQLDDEALDHAEAALPEGGVGGVQAEGRQQLLMALAAARARSEEHTSELQSLMRISYAAFCLKKK